MFLSSEVQILMGQLSLNFLPIRTKILWNLGYLGHSYRLKLGMVVSILTIHRHLLQNCFSFEPTQLLFLAENIRPCFAG